MALFLVAGMCVKTRRIVWIGKDNGWAYDKPFSLHGWETRKEAEDASLLVGKAMEDLFGAVLGGSFLTGIPDVQYVKVVEFERRAPPPPPKQERPHSLWLIQVTSPSGAVTWLGNEECPAVSPIGLKAFTHQWEAEAVKAVLDRGTSGSTFVVKEFVRKGGK